MRTQTGAHAAHCTRMAMAQAAAVGPIARQATVLSRAGALAPARTHSMHQQSRGQRPRARSPHPLSSPALGPGPVFVLLVAERADLARPLASRPVAARDELLAARPLALEDDAGEVVVGCGAQRGRRAVILVTSAASTASCEAASVLKRRSPSFKRAAAKGRIVLRSTSLPGRLYPIMLRSTSLPDYSLLSTTVYHSLPQSTGRQ